MGKPIINYIKDYYVLIKEGQKLKDKALFFLYFLGIPLRMFYRKIGKEYDATLLSDVTTENQDGVFFCGNSFLVAQVVISTYEAASKKYFNLKEGVFVDIGANVGRYTILQGRKLKKGRVVAIEPAPIDFKILNKNIKLNHLKNVTSVKVACSDKKGKADFWLGAEGNGTAHSLTEIKDRSKKISVKTDTLDNVMEELNIEKVDLIKIDVEGAEPSIFRGASKTLENHPTIIFEAINEEKLNECKKELLKFGYSIKRLSERDHVAEFNRGMEDEICQVCGKDHVKEGISDCWRRDKRELTKEEIKIIEKGLNLNKEMKNDKQ